MADIQKIKEALDEASKGGAQRLLLSMKTFCLDLYNEIDKLSRQNKYLRLRVDGMSHEEALKKLSGSSGSEPVVAVAAGVSTASPSPSTAPEPVSTLAAAAAAAPGGTRLGANGEPLSPEEQAAEEAMDAAIEEGIKSGVASKVE